MIRIDSDSIRETLFSDAISGVHRRVNAAKDPVCRYPVAEFSMAWGSLIAACAVSSGAPDEVASIRSCYEWLLSSEYIAADKMFERDRSAVAAYLSSTSRKCK